MSKQLNSINLQLGLICGLGLLISLYGYYVEVQAETGGDDYKAMCDISETISCTKVFATPYGKGFGVIGRLFGEDSVLNVPNGLFGILFYATSIVLSFTQSGALLNVHLILAVLSNVLTVYLAYLLIFVIKNLCVVCVSMYVVNALSLVFCLRKKRILEFVSSRKHQ